MVITINLNEIPSFQMEGFIFCGEDIIPPETASKEDIKYLSSHGYRMIGVN